MRDVLNMPGLSVGTAEKQKSVVEPQAARRGLTRLRQMLTSLRQHGQGLLVRSGSRRLRLAETVSLGDKRFVSILEANGEQFLLGGTSSQMVLLAKLEGKVEEHGSMQAQDSFADVFSNLEASHTGRAPVIHEVRIEGWCA